MKLIVNIDVPQLAPAIDFYCNAFGLSLGRILDDDVAELTGASIHIYLLQKAPHSSPAINLPQARHYSRHWTPVHIDYVVDDIARAEKKVLAAGAKRESECTEWRGSKCITFSDPFGHGFCLIEFVGESYE